MRPDTMTGRVGADTGAAVMRPRFSRVVTNLSELHRVASWRTLPRRPLSVSLRLAPLGADASDRWEYLLNQRLAACGCGEGSVAMLSTVTLLLGYRVATSGWSALNGGFVLRALGIGVLAALVAKLVALLNAQLRLSRIVRALAETLESSTHNVGSSAVTSDGS